MSEQNHPDEEQALQAPPRLVEALRRLEPPAILVPPQIDEAALSRPRLHLARIRQSQQQAQGPLTARSEELALAARTRGPTHPPSLFAAEGGLAPLARHRRPRWWRRVALWAALVVLVAAVLLLRACWNSPPTHHEAPGIRFKPPSEQ